MKGIFTLAFGLVAAMAQAQVVIANDQTGTGTFYMLNVSTGGATPLFSGTTAQYKAWGMAADNDNKILYWNNGGSLYSATYASILSGTPVFNGPVPLTFNAAAVNYVALAYNPASGKLLGTRNIATEAVYEVDPVTGVGTQVYVYPTTYDFGGLDYDVVTGKLYGLSDGAGAGLYHIDVTGQTQTLIAGYPTGVTDIDGLAVGGGKAYYVRDGIGATEPIAVYNLVTNAFEADIPNPFTGSGTFCAAAWCPALLPPSMASVLPTSHAAGPGTILAGGTAEVGASDDTFVAVRPGAILIATQDPVAYTVTGAAPMAVASTLKVVVESRATAGGIRQVIEARNFTAGTWTELESFTGLPTGADRAVQLNVPNPADHIDEANGNQMQIRVRCKNTTPVLVYPWQVRFDEVTWRIAG